MNTFSLIDHVGGVRPPRRLLNIGDPMRVFGPPSALRSYSRLATEVYYDGDRYHVRVDMPGIDKGDIDISLVDKVLTIAGERKSVSGDSRVDTEVSYGSFSKRVSLPKDVDVSDPDATFKNGVLDVSFKLLEDEKPKKIEIKLLE